MSAQIKTITIEADNAEDAAKQLREKLAGKVPSGLLDQIVDRIVGEAKQEKPINTAAEFVADVLSQPQDKQFDRMQELLLQRSLSKGISREKALEMMNEGLAEVSAMFDALGIKRPKDFTDRKFGDTDKTGTVKPEAGEANTRTDRPVKGEFDVAVERISNVKGRDVAGSMGHFYQHQEDLLTVMQYVAHEAAVNGNVAAAKLYLHLEGFVQTTNRGIFDTCREAGVNPEHLGFGNEQAYYSNIQSEGLHEIRQACLDLINKQ